MKVLFSLLFVLAVIVLILGLCVLLMINSASKDHYPDIKDL